MVDQVNLTHFNDNSLQNNKQMTVTGKYSFTGNTTFQDVVEVDSEMNGLPFDDIMTTSTQQNITATHAFADTVTIKNQNLDIHNFTINGVSMEMVMTKSGKQTITGNKSFKEVSFDNMAFRGSVQGKKGFIILCT